MLNRLFAAARSEPAPAPPAGFAGDVLRAVRSEPAPGPAAGPSVFAQLDRLFPRLALAAAAVIVLCVAADRGLTAAGFPDIGDGVAQVTSQLTFDAEDL